MSEELATMEHYDLLGVDPAQKIKLEELADSIKTKKRKMVEDYREMGRLFAEAKNIIPHGQFMVFAEKICNMSSRAVNYAMQVYEGTKGLTELERGQFNVSTLVKLTRSTTPSEVKDKAYEMAKRGENINERKLDKLIREYKQTSEDYKNNRVNKEIDAKVRAAIKGRRAPRIQDGEYKAPDNVSLIPIDQPEVTLATIGDNVYDLMIVVISNNDEGRWVVGQEGRAHLKRVVKNTGHILVVSYPFYLPYITNLYDPEDLVNVLFGRMESPEARTYPSDQVNNFIVAAWYCFAQDKSTIPKISNAVVSDARVTESGELEIGINEMVAILQGLGSEVEKVAAININKGQAAEAATLPDIAKRITVYTPPEKLRDIAFRLSGYRDEESVPVVQDVNYEEVDND